MLNVGKEVECRSELREALNQFQNHVAGRDAVLTSNGSVRSRMLRSLTLGCTGQGR